MNFLSKLPAWTKKTTNRYLALLVVTILVVFAVRSGGDEVVVESTPLLPVVETTTARELTYSDSVSLIGTVRSISEANITSERAGRVTSVPVSLGDTVSVGKVIATIENASEQAAVLQAEGAYEAAVAASALSGVGVDEARTNLEVAENNAVSTYKNAYNTVNNVILNNVDTFFSTPNATLPGLKIDGRGYTAFLNDERVSYQNLLPLWSGFATSLTPDDNLEIELQAAISHVEKTLVIVDTFIIIFNDQGNSRAYTDSELLSFSASFTGLRSNLVATQGELQNALSTLASAKDTLKKAELSASGGTTSTADAQVKQALGSLRAAQANLGKTILRSPISGTVNALTVRTGDFVGSFESVATVANNGAFEIVTYVGDSEKERIMIGDLATIDGSYSGVISDIAPAIDAATGKTEVRFASEAIGLTNGKTVRIALSATTSSAVIDTIEVPLTALKFKSENGSLLKVENGVLVEVPVTLGAVRGDVAVIEAGITLDTEFVKDARGLTSGDAVTLKQ